MKTNGKPKSKIYFHTKMQIDSTTMIKTFVKKKLCSTAYAWKPLLLRLLCPTDFATCPTS